MARERRERLRTILEVVIVLPGIRPTTFGLLGLKMQGENFFTIGCLTDQETYW